jgi:hypothetical protein
MRRVLFLLSLVMIVAVPAAQLVVACGDKFLQTGRGLSQRHYAPIFAASVLVFAPARSGGAALFKDQKLQAALESSGHKLVVVQDEARLSEALKAASPYDLVLVGDSDLAVFERVAGTAKPAPTVLPVMSNKPTKTEVAACRQQYDCQLKSSDRLDDFLEQMDKAMKARAKTVVGKKK